MSESNTEAQAVVERLAELKLRLDDDLPYRLEKMFPKLEGWGSKGEIKRKVGWINQLEPTLDRLLMPREEVLYIAKGVQHSIIEAMTIGALWSNLINQRHSSSPICG